MAPDELRAAIQQRGLTLTKAASVLGVSRVHISNMQSGKSRITPDRASLIRMRLDEYDGKRLSESL